MDRSSWWKHRRFWWGIVLGGFLLFYLIGGFFLVPWWIRGEFVSSVQDNYQLEVDPGLEVSFNPFTFELSVEDGQIKNNGKNVLSFHSVSVDFEPTNSLFNWTWTVDRLRVDSPRVHVRLGEDKTLNWTTILARGGTNSTADSGLDSLYLDSLRLTDAIVWWKDRSHKLKSVVPLRRLSLRGDVLQWPPPGTLDLQVKARVGNEGTLGSTLTWHPDDSRVDARLELNDIPLRMGNDYFHRYVQGEWSSGRANLTGHVVAKPKSRAVRLESSLEIRNARMDGGSDTRLIGWDRLSADTFALNTATREVDLQGLSLRQLFMRFVVAEGYKTNLQKLLTDKAAAGHDTGAVRPEPPTDWTYSLGPVAIRSAKIDFRDDNVPGSFHTRIDDLGGTAGQLNSRGSQPATIDLQGKTGQQGQLSVTGLIDPFDTSPRTDVEMDFRKISMVSYSPYVVKFAGYRVDGGKLRLKLKYRVRGDQLSGSNRIVLDRFQLGRRVTEDSVFNLPVKLAVALLKDENGVIDVDIPVEGDLNNPHFDLRQVIRQAVSSMFTSIVSSPFDFLASLVGAEAEQLRTVRFEPGGASVSGEAEKSIQKIAEALKKRPRLNLEIRPVWTTGDHRTLARGKTDDMIRDAGGDPEYLVASQSVVEQVYLRAHSRSSMRELREKHSWEKHTGFYEKSDRQAYLRDLYEQVVNQVEIPEETLRELARSRARNFRDRLKSLGIDVERLFILDVHRVESPIDKPVELPLSPRG